MKRRAWMRQARDRGAAAIEFALLFPLLMLIVFGTIDFGRALNEQITLTQAAREGVRLDALGEPNVAAQTQSGGDRAEPGQRHRDCLPAWRRANVERGSQR